MYKYDLSNIEIKIYYETCAEFEEVRELCLAESSWLADNYTKENLVVEQHYGYGVVYQKSTGKPMVMGGVFNDGRFPNTVAKMVSREHTFLDFRMTRKDMIDGFKVTCKLIDSLIAVNQFDCYFISMQNRPHRPRKRWWDVWTTAMIEASNGSWKTVDGYLQTCPWPVQKCWQNFVYLETVPEAYSKWNPQVINHDTWLSLDEGK
jgi:hypothetical protein